MNKQASFNYNSIVQSLNELSDEKYRAFSKKLINTHYEILGVRCTELRKLAKKIASEDFYDYMNSAKHNTYEEVMLKGMVIGVARIELNERLEQIKYFLGLIDNWGICDSFCSSLHFKCNELPLIFEFIKPYLDSANEYEVRFALVMMLDFFHY